MIKRCFGSLTAILVFSTAIAQPWSEFSYVDKFYEGRAIVVRGGKCGFIDEQGKIVVPLIYAFAKPFSEGLAPVVKGQWISQSWIDGFFGYVDLYGKEVAPFEYEDAKSFSEGIAAVLIDGKWGGIDREGNLVIKPQFDDSFCFCSDLAVVGIKAGDGMRFGYIDKKGNMVLPCQYDAALDFNGDRSWIEKDGEMFQIDKTGTPVSGAKLHNFSWGGRYGFLTGARMDDAGNLRYGMLNSAGETILPFEFDFISVYELGDEDYAVVDKGAEKRRYLIKGPAEIVRVK